MTKLDRAIAAIEKAHRLLDELRAEQAGAERHRGIPPSSGIRGVSRCKRTSRWSARLWVDGKTKWIGTYDTAEEAAAAIESAKVDASAVPQSECGATAECGK